MKPTRARPPATTSAGRPAGAAARSGRGFAPSPVIEVGRGVQQVGQVRPRHLGVGDLRVLADHRDVAQLALPGEPLEFHGRAGGAGRLPVLRRVTRADRQLRVSTDLPLG